METSVDTLNLAQHTATSLTLGLGGWVLGHAVERTVGSRGMAVRVLVNALVLWSVLALLPWSIVSHFQNTLPGVIACAAFFNSQRWDTMKLV
jgi:hypothetical protein